MSISAATHTLKRRVIMVLSSIVLGILAGSTADVYAQAASANDTPRTSLVDTYLKQARERPPIFQSAPVTHIVPAFNTVTYAVEGELIDTTVLPEDLNQTLSGTEQSLKIEGYRFAPYVALSLKRFGIGFNVEAGQRTITYDYDAGPYQDYFIDQDSAMSYRGLGIYGFVKLLDKRRLTSTLIMGGRTINAKHTIDHVRWNKEESSDPNAYRYTVNQYQTGLNIGLKLLKSFTIIPWADYHYNDDVAGRTQVDELYAQNSPDAALLREDLELLWHAKPQLNYGIDFAIRIQSFEVHIGGLFGLFVASGSNAEHIEDKGYSLSISFDHKG